MRDYEKESYDLKCKHRMYSSSFQENQFFDLVDFGDTIYISRKLAGKINMDRVERFVGDVLATSLVLSINTNFELSRFYLFDFINKTVDLGGVRFRFIIDDDIQNNVIVINRDCGELKLYVLI